MRTIATLEGTEFLKRINVIRKKISKPLKELGVIEILRTKPVYDGKETDEEKAAKDNAQVRKNMDCVLDRMLEEKPEETIRIIELMCVKDSPEEEIEGIDYLLMGMELITSQKVVNFLSYLMKSGLLNMED